MTIKRKTFLGGIFLFVGFCMETSLSQDSCVDYTRIEVPGAMPLNQTTTYNSNTQSGCESSCVSNANCYGYSWFGSTCKVNIASVRAINYSYNSSEASPPVYYSLIKSFSNCNQTQQCSYFWYGQKDLHAFGGQRNGKSDLNDCVKSCQENSSCVALDWDIDANSCFIFTSKDAITGSAPRVYHFQKFCQTWTTVPISGSPATTKTTVSTSSASRPGTPVASPSSSIQTTPITTPRTTMPASTSKPSSSSSALASASSSTSSASASASASSSASASASASSSSSSAAASSSYSSSSASTISTTASLCKNVTCGPDRVCRENATSGTSNCVCNTSCNPLSSSVCGSNNVTYGNECLLKAAACEANTAITVIQKGSCDSSEPAAQSDSGGEYASYPMAIKPAYIVLAGLGGGCLLLVLTAVIILCQYPLNGAETYSSSGTLVNGNRYATQDINMDNGGEGLENVEINPYYNRSELGAPDFTKEENIM